MPRKPGKVPSYCRHKHSGQAVVRINGRDHYLGEYGSSDSHERYQRLIAEWRENQAVNSQSRRPVSTVDLSITACCWPTGGTPRTTTPRTANRPKN